MDELSARAVPCRHRRSGASVIGSMLIDADCVAEVIEKAQADGLLF
jgi:hypothetical protein